MLPKAFLFDMDGTLTDSEKLWFDAEVEVLSRYGIPWVEGDQYDVVGMSLTNAGQYFVDRFGFDHTADEFGHMILDAVVEIGKHEGLEWREGARELLSAAHEWGIPCALVTSSYRKFTQLTLDALPEGTFHAVVTGDMLTRGKPDPEPYLMAAQLLGVEPAQCMAFEDSVPGVTSAHASGALTVGIPFGVEIPQLPGMVTVPSLAELSRERVEELFSEWDARQ
ncbi:HAD superfamily hydrolase (TIGR01509 family) [Arcanobacterium wilhelmae]|uniref:HAD superfamily hydrolase (TIGR01509 family) n=1 Tax=Arcanobacterium wilhelmae TaxID=1803177 RepID=A0ABT9N8V4_9ACTO|nr:HAD family phosphatase [Arcanobacterium wilhelmae]MDP9799968.1 HAD superfamily hydrolase (TIGR01509 family) [Arcanobacterium wilhelmae]WFN91101.1 HAD family phosphatase [Arcanobacterium wilhelmae]